MKVEEFYMLHQNKGNKLKMGQIKGLARYLNWNGKAKFITLLIDLQELKFITTGEYMDLIQLEPIKENQQ